MTRLNIKTSSQRDIQQNVDNRETHEKVNNATKNMRFNEKKIFHFVKREKTQSLSFFRKRSAFDNLRRTSRLKETDLIIFVRSNFKYFNMSKYLQNVFFEISTQNQIVENNESFDEKERKLNLNYENFNA